MAPIVPSGDLGKLQFYEAHLNPWATNAAAIGLSVDQITAIDTLTQAARAAFDAKEAAEQAKLAATQSFYDAVSSMQATGAGLIATIKAKAKADDDPSVYTLAEIPAPGTPTPTPAPGTPFDFRVSLLQNGAVELTFKADNPSNPGGIVYQVLRQDAPQTAFAFLVNAGEKRFVDTSIPAGTSSVVYQVTGYRGAKAGNPAQFQVRFTAGNGAQVVGQPVSQPLGQPSMAA